MKINTVDNGSQVTLEVDGELTLKSYRDLLDTIETLSERHPAPERVTINLGSVDYADSVGLGSLVRMFMILKKAGAQMVLRDLQQSLRDSLALTRLDQLLTIE
jgi:anti-anti-sigma factor